MSLKKATMAAAALAAALGWGLAPADGMARPHGCGSVDWHALGLEDGRNGWPASYVRERQTSCLGPSYDIDATEYEEGRRLGLQEYCTPDGLYDFARRGVPYRGGCAALTEELKQAHARGVSYRTLDQQLDRLLQRRRYDGWSYRGRDLRAGISQRRHLELLATGSSFTGYYDVQLQREIDRVARELAFFDGPFPPQR